MRSEGIEKEIGSLPRSRGETLRLRAKVFNGHPIADLRIFYDDDGQPRPTKKGVPVALLQIDRLIELLQKAKAELQEMAPTRGGAERSRE